MEPHWSPFRALVEPLCRPRGRGCLVQYCCGEVARRPRQPKTVVFLSVRYTRLKEILNRHCKCTELMAFPVFLIIFENGLADPSPKNKYPIFPRSVNQSLFSPRTSMCGIREKFMDRHGCEKLLGVSWAVAGKYLRYKFSCEQQLEPIAGAKN